MERAAQTTPPVLASDMPGAASFPCVHRDEDEIESEVMTLFELYRDPLLRYALSLGLPVPDAEEIVQDVFLSLFRHLRLGRSRRNLRGWIFRVTHNLTLRRRHEESRQMRWIDGDAEIADLQTDPSPTPEEFWSSAQTRERLEAVVRSLPDLEQSCLRLRAEGLRYREIAEVLGISLGGVSAHLARSFAKLNHADRG